MKFTILKHILALLTCGLTCPGIEWQALKKWKMEPGHPVDLFDEIILENRIFTLHTAAKVILI